MMIERRFFVWNEADNHTAVRLGDRIDLLLDKKIIVPSNNQEEFRLAQNVDILVSAKNNLVQYIFFTQNSGDALLKIDPFKFKYPATEPITKYLQNKYELLPYQNIEEAKKHYSGDLIYLIFRDFNPSNVFLLRLENKHE